MIIGSRSIKRGASWARIVIVTALLSFWMCVSYAADRDKSSLSYKDYNVLMISLSNVGAEHMSLYGYKRQTTPFLDKWAEDALVFESAFSHGSWTLPVATSLFTSLYPYTHKIFLRDTQNILDKDIKTLPQILRENDYMTAAFTGGLDYYNGFGHMRGFDDTQDNPNFSGFDVTLPQAKNWLFQNSSEKFFLFIHGYDTHCPFTPPAKFRGIFSGRKGKKVRVDSQRCVRGFLNSSDNVYQAYYAGGCVEFRSNRKCPPVKPVQLTYEDTEYLKDLYDEEVLAADSLVGDFLNSLDKKLLEKTIIIILSDHGEMFAKHGRFGRAGTTRGTMYDDVIHVPLIIKLPHSSGKRVAGLAQIIDIMPTILDILDIHPVLQIQGKSLLSLIGAKTDINEYVYTGLAFPKAISRVSDYYNINSINESIRDKNWKLIREVQFRHSKRDASRKTEKEIFELYNLQDDPNELVDVSDKFPEKVVDLRSKLTEWADWAKGFRRGRPSTQEIPDDILRDAQEKGYW